MPRKKIEGTVVSDKMNKTAVIRVERFVTDRLTGKKVKKTQKYKIHDENNTCKIGDFVEAEECRPLSREKRWTLIKIIKSGATKTVKNPEGIADNETEASEEANRS
jgi:small subunit ribosomal protein S17